VPYVIWGGQLRPISENEALSFPARTHVKKTGRYKAHWPVRQQATGAPTHWPVRLATPAAPRSGPP